jgi:hypothetical protein
VISGWVRLNGRTIGSATSGATERANADTQALFQYLWTADANLAVSGGRGVSSIADWTANKAITLPDARGRVLASLDDMGNSAAGRLTAAYFGATGGCSGALGTTLGAACGGESQTLTLAQLPTGITANGSVSTTTTASNVVSGTISAGLISGGTGANFQAMNNGFAQASTISSTGTATVTSNNTSGSAHPQIPPTILVTTYIKL